MFVAVLCYSRLMFIEFTLSQRKAEFYRGLVHALEFFGGSPRTIIFDNLKAAVLNGSGRAACFHPEFLALCGYFCLQPIACERRDPESKGIVEGGVRYVKHNALAGRAEELTRFEDYLALAPLWRDQVANVRIHETTRERPVDRFQQERSLLRTAAGDPLRHRRGRAGRRQPPCADRVRRQSLLDAAAVRAPARHDSRQPRRTPRAARGPGGGPACPLLRARAVDRVAGPPPGGAGAAPAVSGAPHWNTSSMPWDPRHASSTST